MLKPNQSIKCGYTGTHDIGGHSYTYNPLSQITAVDGGTAASYLYDGSDERVFKQTASGWTNYIYRGGQPLTEFSSDGSWNDYIYANGQKIAKATNANVVNYYLDDHLGTTQVELDSSGNVTWQGQFTPFGQELPDGTTSMHYKFTGKERDAETGLDFFGARYYGNTIGRWLSPDWAAKPEAVPYSSLNDPQSLNLYNYVGNNPLSKADADGHCPLCPFFEAIGDSPAGEEISNTVELQSNKILDIASAAIAATATFVATNAKAIGEANAQYYANGGGADSAWAGSLAKVPTRTKSPSGQTGSPIGPNHVGNLPKPPTGKGSVPPDQRDPKRLYTRGQNDKKLAQQGGKCAHCGRPLKPGEGVGHHIDRHADGGPTNDPNHAVVCLDCHNNDLHGH